jgi:hypothetical protein
VAASTFSAAAAGILPRLSAAGATAALGGLSATTATTLESNSVVYIRNRLLLTNSAGFFYSPLGRTRTAILLLLLLLLLCYFTHIYYSNIYEYFTAHI